MPWNPSQYLGFKAQRLRPAIDLLNAIPELPSQAPSIVDLGCGPGQLSELLLQRWPAARYCGVDGSVEMLAQAASQWPTLRWQHADIANWQPDGPVDLIYSNAALHWLDDHADLMARLMSYLTPGGVLAVQMPNNFLEASHQCAFELARQPEFAAVLERIIRPQPVHPAARYWEWLKPLASHIDLWQTQYCQGMQGENPVADWTKGSLLVPILDALGPQQGPVFEQRYRLAIQQAYPPLPDGTTLFPFKRFFMIAQT